MPLRVELVSPERVLFQGEATMVRARTVDGGDIAFLPGHTPFVGALATWTLEIAMVDGSTELAAVHGGFIEVSDDHVKVLSNLAEMASAIDADRARRAKERHETAAARGEDAGAEAGLRRAHARLVATGQLAG
jgi:F-type H+-transporting ATPase subunit epsilon